MQMLQEMMKPIQDYRESLCKYKNSLGEIGKGVHSHRLFGVAIVDVIMTIIGGFLFALLFGVTPWKMIAGLFILGIVMHRIFCVKTTIDKLLFPNAM
jgi:fructose-1,6-bisphosphatase/inositol monophosphatase family enzyme